MAERIYTRTEQERLESLEEKLFSSEDELQTLIAGHLELLDGEQIRPSDPQRWTLITREKGIAETSDVASRWAIDHLIIDWDAIPTLVEMKRGPNPEIRRTFEESTSAKGLDPGDELATLLQADGEVDADGFWRNVSKNLNTKRLRLLFVSNDISDPLERVVEFLNAQMPDIEVLAVEIKQFRGKSTQTLVSRVIGRTATSSAAGSRPKLTLESFLDGFDSDEARGVADRLLDVALESGCKLDWGPSGVSVRMGCSVWQQSISLA